MARTSDLNLKVVVEVLRLLGHGLEVQVRRGGLGLTEDRKHT
jgi:hypothetical protein